MVLAAWVAERSGPFWAALIATLPISAGPIYVLIALEHDAAFLSEAAVGTIVALVPTGLFILCLALLSSRFGTGVGLVAGLLVWGAGALLAARLSFDVVSATLSAVAALVLCHFFSAGQRSRSVALSHAARWYDVPLRAALVGVLVAAVSTISSLLGPTATGLAAVFPIVMISLAIIINARLGPDAVSATMASAFVPLVGFAFALVAVHVVAHGGDRWAALGVGLLISLMWAAALAARRLYFTRTVSSRA